MGVTAASFFVGHRWIVRTDAAGFLQPDQIFQKFKWFGKFRMPREHAYAIDQRCVARKLLDCPRHSDPDQRGLCQSVPQRLQRTKDEHPVRIAGMPGSMACN
jgi:hypothetical protein